MELRQEGGSEQRSSLFPEVCWQLHILSGMAALRSEKNKREKHFSLRRENERENKRREDTEKKRHALLI